jgi:hypothetical protein
MRVPHPTRCSLGGDFECRISLNIAKNSTFNVRVCALDPFCTILMRPWGSVPPKSMQRTIARLLLLFAFAGNLIPLALAATATPPHACCIRKTHHCHNSAASSSQPELLSRDCCRQSCGQVVITAPWAHPQTHAASTKDQIVTSRLTPLDQPAFSSESLIQQATRAPPLLSRI